MLGLASLFVAIPRNEQQGFKAGPLSVNVETHHREKVAPAVSAIMIVAGACMMIAVKVTR